MSSDKAGDRALETSETERKLEDDYGEDGEGEDEPATERDAIGDVGENMARDCTSARTIAVAAVASLTNAESQIAAAAVALLFVVDGDVCAPFRGRDPSSRFGLSGRARAECYIERLAREVTAKFSRALSEHFSLATAMLPTTPVYASAPRSGADLAGTVDSALAASILAFLRRMEMVEIAAKCAIASLREIERVAFAFSGVETDREADATLLDAKRVLNDAAKGENVWRAWLDVRTVDPERDGDTRSLRCAALCTLPREMRQTTSVAMARDSARKATVAIGLAEDIRVTKSASAAALLALEAAAHCMTSAKLWLDEARRCYVGLAAGSAHDAHGRQKR